MAPARLRTLWSQPGLLVGLSGDHQVVEAVLVAVLLEQGHHGPEALGVTLVARVLDPVGLLEVSIDEDVAGESPLPVLLGELAQELLELRAVLPEGPPDVRALLHRQVGARFDVVERLGPQVHHEAVGHGDGVDAGVGELEDVLALEVLGHRLDVDRSESLLRQRGVEFLQALEEGARRTDVDLLPRQVLQPTEVGRAGPGHHDLGHRPAHRFGEVHRLEPTLGDGQGGGGDVPVALGEGRKQPVPGHRQEHDVDLEIALLEAPVELLLQEPPELVGDAPLLTEIDEVVGGVERHQKTDQAALHHLVEVPGPGHHDLLELFGDHEVRALVRALGRGLRSRVCRRPRPGLAGGLSARRLLARAAGGQDECGVAQGGEGDERGPTPFGHASKYLFEATDARAKEPTVCRRGLGVSPGRSSDRRPSCRSPGPPRARPARRSRA